MQPYAIKRLIPSLLALLQCIFTYASDFNNEDTILVKRASTMSIYEIMDLADSARDVGEKQKAMALYMSVCNHKNTNPTEEIKQELVKAWLSAGDILLERGSYAEALKMYIQGLKVSDTCKKQPYSASLYKNIGNVYCRFFDYERGTFYYKKALEMCKEYPDRLTEKKTLVNLAGVSVIMDSIDQAKNFYKQSRSISITDNADLAFMDKYNHGQILVADKKYPEAVICFRDLIDFANRQQLHPRYLCSAYQQLYHTYGSSGQNDSMMTYMKKCLETARLNNIEHMFTSAMLDFSQYFQQTGNIHAAQEYKNRYLNFRDSLQNIRQFDAIKHAQFLYETEKVSDKINLLQQQKEEREEIVNRQRIIILSITTAMAVILAFLFMIYRQKKDIDRSHRNLYLINNKYVSAQEEMRRNHENDKRLLQEKDDEIASMKAILKQGENDGWHTSVYSSRPKYSSSNLDETRLRAIADAISSVMDNGTEFCNPDFSLDILSSLVDSNNKYVSQAINETFGKNFSNYVNEYRVNLACHRLADSDKFGNYTIKAIGESVGFKSQSTFINVFRKMTGITPSIYQKIAEKEKKERNDSQFLNCE